MLTFFALAALTAVVLIANSRLPASSSLSSLGVMSDQWLAEHRASR